MGMVESPQKLKQHNVLAEVVRTRAVYGVAVQDFGRYRRHCARRIRRLRRELKELGFETLEPRPKRKQKRRKLVVPAVARTSNRRKRRMPARVRRLIPEGYEPTLKFVKLCIAQAERYWAVASREEHAIRHGALQSSAARRHHIKRRLYFATRMVQRCLACCLIDGVLHCLDAPTYIELRIYYCYLAGRWRLLSRKYLQCMEVLTEGRVLCLRIKQTDAVDRMMALMADSIKGVDTHKGIPLELKLAAKQKGATDANNLLRALYASSLEETPVAEDVQSQRFLIPRFVSFDITTNELLYRIKDVIKLLSSQRSQLRDTSTKNAVLEELMVKTSDSLDQLQEVAVVGLSDVPSQLLWLFDLTQVCSRLLVRMNKVLAPLKEGLATILKLYTGFLPYMEDGLKRQAFVDRTCARVFRPEVYLQLIDFCLQSWLDLNFTKCTLAKAPLEAFQFHAIKTVLQNCKALLLAILLSYEGELDKSYVLCNLVSQRVADIVKYDALPESQEGLGLNLAIPFHELVDELNSLDKVVAHYASRFQAVFTTVLTEKGLQKRFPVASADSNLPPQRLPLIYPRPFVMDVVDIIQDANLAKATEAAKFVPREPLPAKGGFFRKIFG
eukprot:Protomagalhaensia_sp_Gyna_25__2208@NODE_21_length_7814_cov_1312_689003_g14_i0_p1_GENE_NODE_21_length_7814_cov_1312_689003_g14_i0NODE_21_length_7814_cov_1312_689003_g14_i0_p1_ORF_typecomplete_len613_score85_64SRP68/PF16969_5/7_7e19SHE3/PF17078_5/0_15SHE3/PF17078_5/13HTH_28/PF13518_6/0_59HTH_28/PF13518_6/7_9e03_NODE_21_length_7814_cov_1312_689003_g14_i0381876